MDSSGYDDVVVMWSDNRKLISPSTCRVPALSLLVAALLLTAAGSSPAGAGQPRRRAAAAGSSSVASRESVLEYYLLEELYPRTFVGNIVTEYGLDRRYAPSVIDQLRFGFLTHSQPTGIYRP